MLDTGAFIVPSALTAVACGESTISRPHNWLQNTFFCSPFLPSFPFDLSLHLLVAALHVTPASSSGRRLANNTSRIFLSLALYSNQKHAPFTPFPSRKPYAAFFLQYINATQASWNTTGSLPTVALLLAQWASPTALLPLET